jgi:hypothetical protein
MMQQSGVASGSLADRALSGPGDGMQFPVMVTFTAMTFAPQFFLHDASGVLLGYGTRNALFPDLTLIIHSDASMATPIYMFKIVSVPNFVYSFHDGAGAALGGISHAREEQKFLVSVGDEVRYAFEDETPGLYGIDVLIPVIPVLNALVGLLLAPSWLATQRSAGAPVLRVTKRRTMMESKYRLDLLGEVDARGLECILLAALMMIFRERLTLV